MQTTEKPIFRCSNLASFSARENNGYLTDKQRTQAFENMHRDQYTDTQLENDRELIKRLDIAPALGKSALSDLHEIWLAHNKGFKKPQRDTWATLKGTQAEEDAITLIGQQRNTFYVKNTERKYKDFGNFILTGEADINEAESESLIIDAKCSYDPLTFMNAEVKASKADKYYCQGQGYCELYDAESFIIAFCLVDCPPAIYEQLYYYFKRDNGIIDDTLPEYQQAIAEFEAGHFFKNNPRYTDAERVKFFEFKRDRDFFAEKVDDFNIAAAEYKELTLNRIIQ